ncbi:hypothetical protein I4U23_030697 [Adineta vaga]|nr:hypothetical protein I4U23_030697 [Adineta vaga]
MIRMEVSFEQNSDLICPITLDVCRDPVLAADGHIYERNAILQWIEQQGTSPLTREPLKIDDLHSEINMRELDSSYRSSVEHTNIFISPSSLSMTTNSEQRISPKQCCNMKQVLQIIMVIAFIVSPFIIGTSVIIFLNQSNSMSNISSISQSSLNDTDSSTTYILPNKCTLPNIVPLFSWDNVNKFKYTYYSKVFEATATQMMITFAFRHDPSYWCLDDVSIMDISSRVELVNNGDFENNPSNGFFRCNSYGNSSTILFIASPHSYNGKRSFCDGSVGRPDYLTQKLKTKIGRIYHLSFWLQNMDDLTNSARVLLSY